MTTTEKRGFRLPWGAESRKADDEPMTATAPAAAPPGAIAPATDLPPALAPAPGAGASARPGSSLRRGHADDLGRGPFGLAPATDSQARSSRADSVVDLPGPAPVKSAPAATAAATDTVPEAETPAAEAVAAGPRAPAVEAPAGPAAPTAQAASAAMAWPDVDRRGSPTPVSSDAPPPPIRVIGDGAAARRTNPLVAGLVKAMRDAARTARDETTARMRADATTRVDQIRAESVAAGVALKKQADEDVAGIREWSKSEMARIKAETESRITARRADLVKQTQAQAADAMQYMDEVRSSIAAFETEMERFFDMLLAEEDPARLATLAERLPEPPSFARHAGSATTTPRHAARPRAAQPRGARPAAPAPRRKVVPAAASARAPEAAPDLAVEPEPRLAPAAAAAAEAEAIAGLDEELAAFSSALGRLAAPDLPAADEPDHVDAAPEPAAESEAATDPADTDGHAAVAFESRDDTEALAAWTAALAAMRTARPELDGAPVDALTPTAPAADAPAVAAEPERELRGIAEDEIELDFSAPAGSLMAMMADAPRINSPDDLTPEERIALLGFDELPPDENPEPAPEAAPAATSGVTRVVVTGLTSVAGISAFKTALARVGGVESVSVTSGHDGAFVFSVVHAIATDLRAAVPGFPGFGASMTNDEGSVLDYSVTEPAT